MRYLWRLDFDAPVCRFIDATRSCEKFLVADAIAPQSVHQTGL